MKPIAKIILFLVIAFIIVIIITTAASRKAEAPATTSPSPSESVSSTSSRSMTYTLADVVKHKVATDCWTAVGDNVYDLTPFIEKHPGGVPNISKVCGIDGTAIFTAQHGSSDAAQKVLASLQIGILAD